MNIVQDLTAEIVLAELLASRLAHEVVGPIGAISNGLELMEELGEEAGGDAASLVSASAKIAADRLQFYRMAYGRAGFGVTNLAQLKAAATSFFEDSNSHELSWPLPPILPSLKEGEGRAILVLIEVARDCLVRDGIVRVDLNGASPIVVAEGPDRKLDPQLCAALTGQAGKADLTPRTVHGALAHAFASAIGKQVQVEEMDGRIRFSVAEADG